MSSIRSQSPLAARIRATLLLAALPAGLAPLLATADPAAAQAPVAALDEVVVTAQKRTENVQDVPISISAFSAEYLERLQSERIGDALDFAPNVPRSSGPTGGADGFFFIRGVGQVDNSATVDPGVGVYVDEVFLGRIQGASLDLLDIDRVEVLRGPQGTLFGRNTIGGAVSVITKNPTEDLEGLVRVTLGSRDKRDVQAMLNLPLGDTTGLRASVFSRNQDGWVTNRWTGQDFGAVEDLGGRVKFRWDFSETGSLTIAGDATRRRGSPINTTLLDFNPTAGPTDPRTGVVTLPGFTQTGVPFPFPPQPPGPPLPPPRFPATDLANDRSGNPYLGFNSIAAELPEDTRGVSATLQFDLGFGTLKSISAYRSLEQIAAADLDGTGYVLYDARFEIDQTQFSQELQLTGSIADRAEWLVGAYYFAEESANDTFICQGTNVPARGPTGQPIPLPNVPGQPPPPFPRFVPGPSTRNDGRCLQFVNRIDLDNESIAGYANLEYALTDRWSAFGGLRYTRDTKEQALDSSFDNRAGVATFFGLAPVGGEAPQASPRNPAWPQPIRYENTWSELTPRVGVDFKASDDALFYASWARGFKSGGFGARATPLAPLEIFDPETVTTAEVGFKIEFGEGRARLNGAVFQSDYDDIQLLVLNEAAQFETRNAGDSRVRGIELELRARPTEALDVTLAGGWLDNEYQRVRVGRNAVTGLPFPNQIEITDKLPNSPEYTLDVGAEYRWSLGNGNSFGLRGDYNYRAEHFFQAPNNPFDRQGGYGIASARATFTFPAQGLTVGIYGQNLGDKLYFITKNDTRATLGVATGNYGAPREFGIDASWSF